MNGLTKWIGLAKVQVDKHAPEILTGLGIASMFTAVIFAAKAAPRAEKAIEERKKELDKEKLNVGETISAAWKYYIPTTLALATGTACVLGGASVSAHRTAAIAAAYSISERALTEYEAKVKDIFGENKGESVRTEIIKDRVAADPPKSSEVIITRKGDTLFKETISGRYFKSDIEKVRRIENELNRNLRNEMQISLNDVYAMLGLPITSNVNDYIGWDIEKGYIEFIFVPVMTEDDEPCIAIDYRTPPRPLSNFA